MRRGSQSIVRPFQMFMFARTSPRTSTRSASRQLERFTVVLHTLYAHSRGTPLYPPFVRGGKETGRSVSILPPYEGGIQGGECAATQGWAQRNRYAL